MFLCIPVAASGKKQLQITTHRSCRFCSLFLPSVLSAMMVNWTNWWVYMSLFVNNSHNFDDFCTMKTSLPNRLRDYYMWFSVYFPWLLYIYIYIYIYSENDFLSRTPGFKGYCSYHILFQYCFFIIAVRNTIA